MPRPHGTIAAAASSARRVHADGAHRGARIRGRACTVEGALTEPNAVPLIVLSAARDPVEAHQQPAAPRRQPRALHLDSRAARTSRDALAQINPELLICCRRRRRETSRAGVGVRDQVAADGADRWCSPSGGRDAHRRRPWRRARATRSSLQQPGRLQAVMLRELRAFRAAARARLPRCKSAQDERSQLETRAAALQRRHRPGAGGHRRRCQRRLARAVRRRGRRWPASRSWTCSRSPPTRRCKARWPPACRDAGAITRSRPPPCSADGTVLPLELALALGEYDGEPSVRLIVPARQARRAQLAGRRREAAVHTDPGAGLPAPRELLEALQERLRTPVAGGMRYLALRAARQVRRHRARSRRHRQRAGADRVRQSAAGDAASRTTSPGTSAAPASCVLLERGNEHDIEAWGEQLLDARAASTSCAVRRQVRVGHLHHRPGGGVAGQARRSMP